MGPLSRLLLIGSTAGVLTITLTCFSRTASAQAPPIASPSASSSKLAPFEKDVLETEAAWSKLAGSLESRLARLAPCDPTAARDIEETKKASDARMDALARYYRELQVNAAASTGSVRALIDEQRLLAAGDAGERTDAEQERSTVEGRIVNLEASVQQKPSLAAALTQLQQVESLIRERAAFAALQTTNRSDATSLLQDMLTASQNREVALNRENAALSEEQTGWNGYYAARSARSRTECQAIGGAPASAPAKPARPGTEKAK